MTIQKRLLEAVEQKQLRLWMPSSRWRLPEMITLPLRWQRRCSAVKQEKGTSAYRFRVYPEVRTPILC
jgi:hypothetical protein